MLGCYQTRGGFSESILFCPEGIFPGEFFPELTYPVKEIQTLQLLNLFPLLYSNVKACVCLVHIPQAINPNDMEGCMCLRKGNGIIFILRVTMKDYLSNQRPDTLASFLECVLW